MDPTPQDRVDLGDHPTHGLGSRESENLVEPAPQRGPLLDPRNAYRHRLARMSAAWPKLQPSKAEALCLHQVHDPDLLFVHLYAELAEFLAEPLDYGPSKPLMPRFASTKTTRSSANLACSTGSHLAG